MIRSRLSKLMVLATAVTLTSELLSNSILHVAIEEVLVRLLQDVVDPASSSLWFNIVSQIISLIMGPLLIFGVIYFADTRYDLQRQYKTLLIVMFTGALLSYIVGATVWTAVALTTGIWQAAPNTTSESHILPIWLPFQFMQSLSKSVSYVFVAFTALVISHIGRSPDPSARTAREIRFHSNRSMREIRI